MTDLDAPSTRYRVNDSLRRLRDTVNHPGAHFDALVEDGPRWSRLCVAMDVATDTEDAIQTYIDTPADKVRYLHYYGLMDSWVVQQDAVELIRSELLAWPKMNWTENADYPDLLRNRRLRNHLTSHPTSAKAGKGASVANGIIQFRMGKWHLSYLEWRNGDYTERNVDLQECIAVQRHDITRLIDEAATEYGRRTGFEANYW